MKILLPAGEAGGGGLRSSLRGVSQFVPRALPKGDELVVLGGTEPEGRWLSPARRVRRLLQEQLVVARAARSVDLVHLPDHRPLLLSGTPFLLTVYDVLYFDRPDWFPASVVRYKQLMLRLAIRKRPAAVVAGSAYTRERLLTHFSSLPAERVRVIHPGIWPPEAGAEPAPGSYFLTVNTIEPRKNHLGLLRAFRAARARGLDLSWKVVGAPGYASGPIVAELDREPGVERLGWVSDGDLERLYRGARFVAYPSFAEGFGLPPLEAMARGIPVVTSRGSSLDESVGQAALRVDAEDEAAWAEALLRLASDEEERARLAALGLERAAGFDWPRAAAAYVDAYRAALD